MLLIQFFLFALPEYRRVCYYKLICRTNGVLLGFKVALFPKQTIQINFNVALTVCHYSAYTRWFKYDRD